MKRPEILKGKTGKFVGIPLAALALTSCGGPSKEEIAGALQDVSPIERIDYEFAGGSVHVDGWWRESNNNCLYDTVYDPITGKSAADFEVINDTSGNIIVELIANGGGGVIALTGFGDTSVQLQPVDETSRLKMDALGCFDEE